MVGDANRLDWLALMQHYGTPTRLLDFTRSPYVACFFAIEKLPKKEAAQPKAEGGQRENDAEQPKNEAEQPKNEPERIGNFAIWAVDTDWLITHSTMPECNEDNLRDCEFLGEAFRPIICRGTEASGASNPTASMESETLSATGPFSVPKQS